MRCFTSVANDCMPHWEPLLVAYAADNPESEYATGQWVDKTQPDM